MDFGIWRSWNQSPMDTEEITVYIPEGGLSFVTREQLFSLSKV